MTLPKPPIQNNVDLRSFEFMPLDVVRFRDSDFTALVDAEAFRSGFLLMCASWHQVPAGSLPNDDRILSNLAGFGRVVKEWEKFKDEALHGWVLCDDNRYYHPVVCEKAVESWSSKQEYNYKKFSERLRKSNGKLNDGEQVAIPSFDVWVNCGMPDTWTGNSETHELEEQNISNNQNPKDLNNSKVIPREFQGNAAGIPLENALKGTEHNVRDIINNKTQTLSETEISKIEISATENWQPNSEFLLTVIKTSVGAQADAVVAMPDYEFHLGKFNAHWEDKKELSESQKTYRFATWIINEFKKSQEKPQHFKNSRQPEKPKVNRNVNDAHGDMPYYAPAIDDVDVGEML